MRLYDGCPDDELKAKIDHDNAAFDALWRAGLRATYFPAEDSWMAFEKETHRPASEFFPTIQALAQAVLK